MAEMTNQQFHELVQRVEQYARTHRSAYRFRVGALAVIGYAYVWTILLVCLLILALLALAIFNVPGGAFAVGKLAIPVIVIVGAVLRALWVSFPPPMGVRLRRRDAPPLFGLLDELKAKLDTPRFHRVYLTDDFNAAVAQRPRLGPLGFYQNCLMIGWPLLEALSADEFRAVLAHELGHLSRAHGRFGAWIYRIRMTWTRIVEQLESSHRWGYQLFDWFLKRWAPYFNAYSFVLAREQEYEADRHAAEIAGGPLMARALVAIALHGSRLDRRFWPDVARRAADNPEPPAGVLLELREKVRSPIPPEDGRRWLAVALNQQADTADTHPSLSARLKALDVRPVSLEDLGKAGPPAAETYLGAEHLRFGEQLDANWRKFIAPGWREKHEADGKGKKRLQELERKAAASPLSLKEAAERADLALELQAPEEALGPLDALLALEPDHARANFARGNILLNLLDDGGIPYIERAMRRAPQSRGAAFQLLWLFYEGMGQADRAAEYRKLAWEHEDLTHQSAPERQDVKVDDELLPHEMPELDLDAIREAVDGIKDVAAAYLVRKRVHVLPEVPFYVLGVQHWWAARDGMVSAADEQTFVDQVARQTPIPGDWLIVALNGERAWLHEKLKAVPGAQIKGGAYIGAGQVSEVSPVEEV